MCEDLAVSLNYVYDWDSSPSNLEYNLGVVQKVGDNSKRNFLLLGYAYGLKGVVMSLLNTKVSHRKTVNYWLHVQRDTKITHRERQVSTLETWRALVLKRPYAVYIQYIYMTWQ